MIKRDELKKTIEERGLKRSWVADQIGTTPGNFNQVLKGENSLSLEKTIALAKLLKVELYEIWTDQ